MTHRRRALAAPLSLFAGFLWPVAACSSGHSHAGPGSDAGTGDADDSGADADDASDDGDTGPPAYPAAHPAAPQVVSLKGPVLTAPKIVPIVFQGDSLAPSIATFMTQLVATTEYWGGATSEYGVGPLTATPVISLSEAAPTTTTDAALQTWLTMKIASGNPFPPADANTIYAVFYPSGTTITAGMGTSCQEFEGYHSDFSSGGGGYVTYAVMPRCPPNVMGITPLDQLTSEASHEFIEAATDPLPQDMPAFGEVDADHRSWELFGGGEVGDVCAQFGNVFYKPTGITSLVQHTWSDKAAAAGDDPCEPDGLKPYFNSAPVVTDNVSMTLMTGEVVTTKGVKIPLHQSKTIEVDLFSDAPTSKAWSVSGIDINSAFLGGPTALSFSFDKPSGKNGDKLQMTIKSLQAGPAPFWIESKLGNAVTYWIGVVGN
jgi:hypothetical protein